MTTRDAPPPGTGFVGLPAFQMREPPHSVEAEQSVLGALLLNNACADKVFAIVRPADFYRHENRLVFDVCMGLVASHKPADVITVFERLQSLGQDADVGGMAYLNALALSVPGAANATRYAEIVAEKAQRRRLIVACDDAATAAFNGDDATVVIDQLGDQLAGMQRSSQRVEPKTFRELTLAAIDRYQAIADGKATPAMATGLRPLDRTLGGGLKRGRVYCFAARPSIGKSAVARAVGIYCAHQGSRTLLLSQEMPQDEVTDCIIAQLGRIDSERLQSGGMQQDDWARLNEAVDDFNGLPLLIDEQGGLTIADIRAKARGVRGLNLLIVDYLQLCNSTLKGKSTNDEIAEVSKGLKQLALSLHIPVIVLSQLNRKVEERADKEPQLSDLRDSGAIEQDVDVAILLWTAEHRDNADWRTVGFKVAKNRGGRLGRFAMRFDAPINSWSEATFPPPAASTSSRGSRL